MIVAGADRPADPRGPTLTGTADIPFEVASGSVGGISDASRILILRRIIGAWPDRSARYDFSTEPLSRQNHASDES